MENAAETKSIFHFSAALSIGLAESRGLRPLASPSPCMCSDLVFCVCPACLGRACAAHGPVGPLTAPTPLSVSRPCVSRLCFPVPCSPRERGEAPRPSVGGRRRRPPPRRGLARPAVGVGVVVAVLVDAGEARSRLFLPCDSACSALLGYRRASSPKTPSTPSQPAQIAFPHTKKGGCPRAPAYISQSISPS